MGIRVNKSLSNSYVLDEPELRRIHQVLTEQVVQAYKSDDIRTTFNLKLKNQMTFDKTSLDEIFAESNGGEHAIQELEIDITNRSSRDNISISFSKSEFRSIRYTINGNDRSWVTISQSVIEERIRNIKRSFILTGTFRFLSQVSSGIIAFVMIIFFLTSFVELLTKTTPSGGITVSVKDAIVFLIGFILLAIGIFSYFFFFPPYNFCWGDYIKIYRSRQSIGKFILIVVLIGIVLSVFGSIAASYILSK